MSNDGDKKKSESARIPTLTYGASTNFFTWAAKIKSEVISQFGRISAHIFDGKRIVYTVDQMDTSTWTPEEKQQLASETVKLRIKEHESMLSAVNRVFGLILSHLSEASLERVTLEPEWKDAEREMNARTLWVLVVRTHQVQRTGVAAIDHAHQAKRISDITQERQETLTSFTERFHAMVRGFAELGMTTPPESYLAVRYLDALDDARYVELKNALRNNASLGIMSYPAQLSTAITAAMQFTSTHVAAVKQTKQENAFVVSTRERSPNRKASTRTRDTQQQPSTQPESRQSREEKTTTNERPAVCKLCGCSGHYVVKCPHLEECARRVQQGACDKRDVEQAHLTMGDEEHEEIVFCVTEGTSNVLGANDVLLDNQATVSVFSNKHLLTDVCKGRPITIRGIDDRKGRVVVTDTVGRFGPFGVVHFSPHASANVLSLSSLQNTDFDIEFIQGEKFTARHKESGRIYEFLLRETSTSAGGGLFVMNAAPAADHCEEAAKASNVTCTRGATVDIDAREPDRLMMREANTSAHTPSRAEKGVGVTHKKMRDAHTCNSEDAREDKHDHSPKAKLVKKPHPDSRPPLPTAETRPTPDRRGSGDNIRSENTNQGGSDAKYGRNPARACHAEDQQPPIKGCEDTEHHHNNRRRATANALMDLLAQHLQEEQPRKERDKIPRPGFYSRR